MEEIIKSKIRQYITERVLDNDPRGLTDETKLLAGGVLDSFALMQLVLFIEEEFSVNFQPHEINPDNFQNIDRISSAVSQAGTRQR
jgi:acyl carrier protein